jgi:Fe-S-cluster containining protein
VKILSKKTALQRLYKIKTAYRSEIQTNYETKAKSCLTCETKGACCLDAHFVNVNITRLEAVAMQKSLEKLSVEKQREISERVKATIEKYDLKSEGDTFAKTFACPLFEKGTGCLVHDVKPVPCVQHACYERREDLPPDELQAEAESKIERLNQQIYGKSKWLPLPVWISSLNKDE